MFGAEPPVETGRDKENRTNQESADAADHCNGTAAGKTIQVCLSYGRRQQRCHLTPNVIATSAQEQSMLPIQ
jgi:hypothetical protein